MVREVWYTGGPSPDHAVDVTDDLSRQARRAARAHLADQPRATSTPLLRQRMGDVARAAGLPEGRLAEAFSVFRTE